MTTRNKRRHSATDETPAVLVSSSLEVTPTSSSPADDKLSDLSDVPKPKRRLRSYLNSYWHHKPWAIPLTLIILLILLVAVPPSRYKVVSIFVKGQLSVSVVDNTTGTPISDAQLNFGSVNAKTAANGKAILASLPLGNGSLAVSKQYYRSTMDNLTVSYSKFHNSVVIRLIATGRQVPISITNRITGKPVANAEVDVLDTSAKTDSQGQTIIVLPTDKQILSGTISANSYNDTNIAIQITTKIIPANTFKITPAGHVYFLSNLSGKLDVVQTNLDGTDRKTLLAGTGNESPYDTELLASNDQKYLALLTQRKSAGNPELDLINTTTGKMSNIDEGNATFTLTGWVGDYFIYTVNRQNTPVGKPGAQAIKSFNASSGQLALIDQSPAGGSNAWPYASQTATFTPIYIVDNKLIYSYSWSISTDSYISGQFPGKWWRFSVMSVNPDGTDKKDLKDISLLPWTTSSSIAFEPSEAQVLYIRAYSEPMEEPADGTGISYYKYQDGQVAPVNYSDTQFYAQPNTPTYLYSPSSSQTFWSEPTDGKNTLFVGNQNGQNGKQILVLSDYSPYGWYTNNFLLVSKGNSQLYIMPVAGGSPQFITDYYAPSQLYP